MIKEKFFKAKNKIMGVMYGMVATSSMALTQVYCGKDDNKGGGGTAPFTNNKINVGTTAPDANNVLSNVVTVLCGAVVFVGVLSLINGWSDYTAAKKDENATGMTKAANKMVISIAEIACPLIVKFLFNW